MEVAIPQPWRAVFAKRENDPEECIRALTTADVRSAFPRAGTATDWVAADRQFLPLHLRAGAPWTALASAASEGDPRKLNGFYRFARLYSAMARYGSVADEWLGRILRRWHVPANASVTSKDKCTFSAHALATYAKAHGFVNNSMETEELVASFEDGTGKTPMLTKPREDGEPHSARLVRGDLKTLLAESTFDAKSARDKALTLDRVQKALEDVLANRGTTGDEAVLRDSKMYMVYELRRRATAESEETNAVLRKWASGKVSGISTPVAPVLHSRVNELLANGLTADYITVYIARVVTGKSNPTKQQIREKMSEAVYKSLNELVEEVAPFDGRDTLDADDPLHWCLLADARSITVVARFNGAVSAGEAATLGKRVDTLIGGKMDHGRHSFVASMVDGVTPDNWEALKEFVGLYKTLEIGAKVRAAYDSMVATREGDRFTKKWLVLRDLRMRNVFNRDGGFHRHHRSELLGKLDVPDAEIKRVAGAFSGGWLAFAKNEEMELKKAGHRRPKEARLHRRPRGVGAGAADDGSEDEDSEDEGEGGAPTLPPVAEDVDLEITIPESWATLRDYLHDYARIAKLKGALDSVKETAAGEGREYINQLLATDVFDSTGNVRPSKVAEYDLTKTEAEAFGRHYSNTWLKLLGPLRKTTSEEAARDVAERRSRHFEAEHGDEYMGTRAMHNLTEQAKGGGAANQAKNLVDHIAEHGDLLRSGGLAQRIAEWARSPEGVTGAIRAMKKPGLFSNGAIREPVQSTLEKAGFTAPMIHRLLRDYNDGWLQEADKFRERTAPAGAEAKAAATKRSKREEEYDDDDDDDDAAPPPPSSRGMARIHTGRAAAALYLLGRGPKRHGGGGGSRISTRARGSGTEGRHGWYR